MVAHSQLLARADNQEGDPGGPVIVSEYTSFSDSAEGSVFLLLYAAHSSAREDLRLDLEEESGSLQ